MVVWLTGQPSSGKSTFGERLNAELRARSVLSCLLDGDEVRVALVPRHGYDPKSRDEYYATLGNLAALLAAQGLVVIVAATAHLRAHREHARAAAGTFIEVHVRASQAEVEARDAKGLYAAVREGRVAGVPGADVGYEEPTAPDYVADGGRDAAALARLVSAIEQKLA